ncbi:FAS1-like dehydratase domain-containing protein [Oceanomicrobium pacificus]|uniref:FAS1-like dehydratase domain-containing protein n=1 Tax=Oceanomicrobium pacificus TaxID=2692916 RepID=A0A6B0TSH2_9RHOB|nr:MaoC family dehydratase N-terminal domain-containing protein [Oceanomicrobium pacificus]MXU64152.1 hypothetical protein [Oceanomicrobium pacificus]
MSRTANMTRQTIHDRIDPMRVAAMHATLGRDGPPPATGDALPPFWHWAGFWDCQPPDRLGRDGHPALGGFLPDLGLPRRMWAGGRLRFLGPLRIGEAATRASRILKIAEKTGRSGPLAFVTVEHRIMQGDRVALTEEQDLVYREDPVPGAPQPQPAAAPTDEVQATRHKGDPVTLFRYSALTFNGHRIHYDRDYCRDVEGYPGLVVHGPLLAQMLVDRADATLGGLASFAFRAMAPVFDGEPFEVCHRPEGDGLALWIRGADGRLAMQATANQPFR